MGSRQAGSGSLLVGEAVPSLARWGLSHDADLVYRAVTMADGRSAQALISELGLPARRVHAALAELHEAGATVRRAGKPRPLWTARPAGEVVERLRAGRVRVVDRDAQGRSQWRAVAATTGGRVGPFAAGVGELLGEGVRYLATRVDTRRRLAGLIAVERHEQLAINTEQAFDAASARAAAPLDRDLAARGVRLRVLGLPPADRDLHVEPEVLNAPRCGYREAAELPMKLLVIDRRVALFPADPHNLERGYLEVSHPAMVRSLVALFERHWDSAVDPRECGMPQIILSDRERELINLLAMGHTDISAAAQLRISARTVTNIMRALMDRIGVENRFQLGLALGAIRAVRLSPVPSTPANPTASIEES